MNPLIIKIIRSSSYLDTHFPIITKLNINTYRKYCISLLTNVLNSINMLNPVEQIITNPDSSYEQRRSIKRR